MSLFEDDAATGNAHEYTVSEISGAVKRVIEGEFGQVRVRGEVSRVSRPGSGHLYFDLKDERAVIAAVAWKREAAKMAVRPEEGMEVVATGRLTTFPGQSKYQLIVEDIRPAGVGALMAMLDKRRRALEAEGLFAADRKRPLPFLPQVIGVVTSPSGAVIRDILHRLRDRFPRRVLIWPVAVQGDRCAPEVARAIAGFNALPPGGPIPRPDLLIVARGGGSIEDLWGFNEEIVVRAAAASAIPLISAVGHETDTTLIDHAADRRAPTPTAAAELAVPVRLDLLSWAADQGARLSRALIQGLTRQRQRARDLARALPRPERLTETARQRLDRAADRLDAALRRQVQDRHLALHRAAGVLRPSAFRRHLAEAGRRFATCGDRLTPTLLSRGNARHRDGLSRATARLAAGLRHRVRDHRLVLHRATGSLRPAALRRHLSEARRQFDRTARRLVPSLPQGHLDRHRAALADRAARLAATARARQDRLFQRLDALDRLRQSTGYVQTLKRGYAVVRGDGHVVTTATAARQSRALEIEFQDGRLPIAPPRRKPAGDDDQQGSLF